MFTIKFINFYENEASVQNSLEAPHYQVYKYPDGNIEVTIYKDFLTVDGVSFWVGDRDGVHCYDSCYVENSSGKTIEHLRL